MRILVLLKYAGVECSTAYLEIMRGLCEKGIEIDLVIGNQTPNYRNEDFYVRNKQVNITVLNVTQAVHGKWEFFKKFIMQIECFKNIYMELCSMLKILKFYGKRKKIKNDKLMIFSYFLNDAMRSYVPEKEYDFIWVSDEYGLLWAEYINQKRNDAIKIVYHCLELYWEEYLKVKKRDWYYYIEYVLFEEANKVLNKTEVVVIQDIDRWDVLCKYTGLRDNYPHVLFPVSINDYNVCESKVLRKENKIEEDKDIIFYPTLLMSKRKCLELMEMAKNTDVFLIIHGFTGDNVYIQKLQNSAKSYENIRISNTSIDYQELLEIHRDIWCVFLYYGESNNNDKYIVNSCNKLVMSLQAGRPIITVGNKSLEKLCNKYECGISLEKWSKVEFMKAINKLRKEYDKYSSNARKCYKERYDSAIYMDTLFAKLSEICKNQQG